MMGLRERERMEERIEEYLFKKENATICIGKGLGDEISAGVEIDGDIVIAVSGENLVSALEALIEEL